MALRISACGFSICFLARGFGVDKGLGLGFRVWGLGFRVWDSGFRVQRSAFWLQASGCTVRENVHLDTPRPSTRLQRTLLKTCQEMVPRREL